MTDEQINIAIAESLGWTEISDWKAAGINGLHPSGQWTEVIPNYTSDLNACHEFEINSGMHIYPDRERYYPQLIVVIKSQSCDYPIWMATARQRCEACLRTIGKWIE